MRYLAALALLFTSCVGEKAPAAPSCEHFVGIDAKAAMSEHFPATGLSDALRDVRCPAISFPWSTFGESRRALEAFLGESRADEVLLRVDLYNATCVRNRVCAVGDLFLEETPASLDVPLSRADSASFSALRRRLADIRSLFEELHVRFNVRIIPAIAIGLEDDLSLKGAQNVAQLIREEVPGALVVSNPLRHVRNDGADLSEAHDLSLANVADIYSPDGVYGHDLFSLCDSLLVDSPSRFATFCWFPFLQGRGPSGEGLGVPPRERAISFTPEQAARINESLRAAD